MKSEMMNDVAALLDVGVYYYSSKVPQYAKNPKKRGQVVLVIDKYKQTP